MDGSQQLYHSDGPFLVPMAERFRAGLLVKPIRSAKRTIVILSLALAGCRGAVVPVNPTPDTVALRLLTDSASSPLLRDLAASYHPANIVITWNIQEGEVSTVLDWLKANEAAYALIDYVPDAGFDKTLWSTPVGQDGIAIVVNPTNTVATLTAEQLREIFQGQTIDWKSLGVPSGAITVVTRNDKSSAASLIQSMVLGDRRVTRAARLATTDQAVVDIVSAEPGAIGYVSMGYLANTVRAVPLDGVLPTPDTVTGNQYPLRMPIVFVGLHSPDNDAYRAFFAWVQSPEGQAIVRRHFGGLSTP